MKSPVFPFIRFPGVDSILGPEMKSTGEVMGGATDFGHAFVKAMLGAGQRLPEQRHRLPEREQRRQARGGADCQGAGRDGLCAAGDARHGRVPAGARRGMRRRLQGERGPAQPGRRDRQPPHRHGREHAARPRVVLRRQVGAARRDDGRHPVHHDDDRRRRGRRRRYGRSRGASSRCARCRSTTWRRPASRNAPRGVSRSHASHASHASATHRTRRLRIVHSAASAFRRKTHRSSGR